MFQARKVVEDFVRKGLNRSYDPNMYFLIEYLYESGWEEDEVDDSPWVKSKIDLNNDGTVRINSIVYLSGEGNILYDEKNRSIFLLKVNYDHNLDYGYGPFD